MLNLTQVKHPENSRNQADLQLPQYNTVDQEPRETFAPAQLEDSHETALKKELREFQVVVERRFQESIANRVYTFPRITIDDNAGSANPAAEDPNVDNATTGNHVCNQG